MKNNYINPEIRRLADNLLSTVLIESLKNFNYRFTEHDLNSQDDRGEDFMILLEPREHVEDKFVVPFFIQNKGVKSIYDKIVKRQSHNQFGKISFSLKLRNAKRYCNELTSPIIITVCDISTKVIYWHAIQLDDDFRERIELIDNNGSIQFYVDTENILSSETINRFLSDVQYSKYYLDRKYGNKYLLLPYQVEESVVNSKMHVLEALFTISKTYSALSILPKSILLNLYPFSVQNEKKKHPDNTYHKNLTLFTNNEKLYNFLVNIEYTSEVKFRVKDTEVVNIENYREKIENILIFLRNNLIYNIALIDDYKSLTTIACDKKYNFNIHSKYFDLDYKNTIEGLNLIDTDQSDIFDLLRKAFYLCNFGDYKAACHLYLGLASKFKKQKKHIFYFVCLYNLSLLNRIILSSYTGKDRYDLLNILSKIDLTTAIERLTPNLDPTSISILNWIKNEEFIHSINPKIADKVDSIHQQFLDDQYGSYSQNEFATRLLDYGAELDTFVADNLIIYDSFFEFKKQIHLILKGLIASYAIMNVNSAKVVHIDDFIVHLMINHCDTDKLKEIFNEYNITTIKYISDSVEHSLEKKTENLFNSLEAISQLISLHENSYRLSGKILRLINNIIYLFSKIETTPTATEDFSRRLLEMFERYPFINSSRIENINIFLFSKRELLSTKSFEAWLHWAVTDNNNMHKLRVLNLYPRILLDRNEKYYLKKPELYSVFLQKVEEEFDLERNRDFFWLKEIISLNRIFKPKYKKKLEQMVRKQLEKKFNDTLYYLASIFDIIDYRKNITEYIETIPSNITIRENPRFSSDDNINSRLDDFINLAFKEQINLEPYRYLHDDEPFYKWLMDLENFDYSSFQPRWILLCGSKFHYDQFRKCKKLKKAIEQFIVNNPAKGIVRAYVHIYNPISA